MSCSSGDFINAYYLVLRAKGSGDETAVENVFMECRNNGNVLDGNGGSGQGKLKLFLFYNVVRIFLLLITNYLRKKSDVKIILF